MEKRNNLYFSHFVDNDMWFREMVSFLIPQLSSFAVSGTPAKIRTADLIHFSNYVFEVCFQYY